MQLKVDEKQIRRVQTVKYLGIKVDENLSWNEQRKSLKCKVKCGLSSIRKLKDILTKLEQVFRDLVESYLPYGNELWGSLSDTKLNHLQGLQDRARTLIESSNVKDGWTYNCTVAHYCHIKLKHHNQIKCKDISNSNLHIKRKPSHQISTITSNSNSHSKFIRWPTTVTSN